MKTLLVSATVISLLFVLRAPAQSLAPGSPGKDAQWATAGKQAVGTSANLKSKVWFTLAQGVMTEVYYPDVTVANVHLLQFVVVDPRTKKVETERDDAVHQIKALRPNSLTFQQINSAKSGRWRITKTYYTDPAYDIVYIDVKVEIRPGMKLYIYFDPSLDNSGFHDTAWTATSRDRLGRGDAALFARDAKARSMLQVGTRILDSTNGFVGVNDGLTQLRRFGDIRDHFDKAENGNVAQLAELEPRRSFTVALQFGPVGRRTLDIPLCASARTCDRRVAYEGEWAEYVKTLPNVDAKYQAQFNMAAMQLKAHEDKTHRGANIASLSIPWGGGDNANENTVGGYHLVWSRDLYQVFTAYLALGDKAAANRALDFLFKVQQKSDGSFPQNSWLDGKPFWNSLQMDEVAYPLIMAWQLGRFDKPTWENHVKKAADFIVKNGPKTPQERWEEEGGFSPSTIAAEIAGLVCAAEIAKKNGDTASANLYLKTADDWQSNIENWTATKTGPYGDGNYYLRITQNGRPDSGDKIELNNGAGTFDERTVVDAGFLELVRLGIKPADDPLIAKSVNIIDQLIKVDTPNGAAFYRYNNDGYGEMDDGRRWNFDGQYTGKGRLWALLSGERGQYELAVYVSDMQKMDGQSVMLWRARSRLDAMLAFANDGLMIPEQVWDKSDTPKNIDPQFIPPLKFGEGTGSATPLAWSMAQFIRLATNLKAGRNLDTPEVVYDRYVRGRK